MSRRPLTRKLSGEDGQTLVELALILPVLLAIVFGILEIGRAYNYWIDQTHLANQAARFASVDRRPDSAQTITAYVKGQASAELRNGTGSVGPGLRVCLNTAGKVGDPVTATASATFHWIPILKVTALTSQITGSATMRVEHAPTNYASGECA